MMTNLVLKNIEQEIRELVGQIYSYDGHLWQLFSYTKGECRFVELTNGHYKPRRITVSIWDQQMRQFTRMGEVESK